MFETTCGREGETLRAQRAGRLDGALEEHVRSCAGCAAALEIERELDRLAGRLMGMAQLPDAERLLFRARLRAISAAAGRAARPVELWGRLAGLVSALTVGGLLLRGAPAIMAWLQSARQAAPPADSPLIVVVSLTSLGLAGLLLWLYTSWVEG